MKFLRLAAFLLLPAALFAIDISPNNSARLDLVSRTSFGLDIDSPYRYGLANELTQVDLVFGLANYQPLSNRDNTTTNAIGFIDMTLFHLDLVQWKTKIGYNPPANISTNRYQTGEFLVGITKGPWLIQLNAQGNEPFTSPWNKGLQFVNDGFKLSWSYLDSMVDVRRVTEITRIPAITGRGEENMNGDGQTKAHATMLQFGFDTMGNIADRFGMNTNAQMIAAMYTTNAFGVNVKLGTEKEFWRDSITKDDQNGLAAGIDTVFTPSFADGLKVFLSLAGTSFFGKDEGSIREVDPVKDPVTDKFKFKSGTADWEPKSLFGGARIGYRIPMGEDTSLEPWVGFDMGTYFKKKELAKPDFETGYEASGGFTMRWPGQAGWLKDYIMNSDGRVFPGMSLGYKLYQRIGNDFEKVYGQHQVYGQEGAEGAKAFAPEHSIKFTLFEPKGNDGFFFLLGSEIIVDVIDITNVTANKTRDVALNDPPSGFAILATAYFDLEFNDLGKMPGSLVPWTILYYDNLLETEAVKRAKGVRYNNFKVDLGINLEDAIANTTFGIVWNSGSLLRKVTNEAGELKRMGYIRLMVEIRL